MSLLFNLGLVMAANVPMNYTSMFSRTMLDNLTKILLAILIGFVVLVVGYAIAIVIETILKKMFKRARFEEVIAEHGLSGALMGFTLSGIITGVIKWLVFLYFVVTAVDIIETAINPGGAHSLTTFLTGIVNFIPWLLEGLIILIAGLLLGDFVAARAREGIKFHGKTVGLIIKMVVIYFTAVIVLSIPQYNISTQLLITVFEYLALGIALGIAGAMTLGLGLGMKDTIGRIVKKHEREIEHLFTGSED